MMSSGDLNLYDLIFKTFLQLPDCMREGSWGCINGVFAHDFVYALLLPHIVLLIFIFGASRIGEHKGLATLLGIAIYIFIIYGGYYAIFASFTLFWLALSIFISAGLFIMGKIINPAKAQSIYGLIKNQRSKRVLREEIHRLENQLRQPGLGERERAAIQSELARLRVELSKS